jgi:hypothetical protein
MLELCPCAMCNGTGSFTVGDCEEGIFEVCPDCLGSGEEECYG